jgi:hypothetical protein
MLDSTVDFLTQLNWRPLLLGGLWTGLVAFTLGLSFLLWTRWGYYHLTAKCVLFSVLAHVLLGLFFATGAVIDNVANAMNPPEVQAPITIERVEIVRDDDAMGDSAIDGASHDEGPASAWDKPANAVVISEPAATQPAPEPRSEAPTRAETAELPALPKDAPRPDVPLPAPATEPPKLAQSAPETPDRAETTAAPEAVAAQASESPHELLPADNPAPLAPRFPTEPVARTRPAPSDEEMREDVKPTAPRPITDIELRSASPDAPARAITTSTPSTETESRPSDRPIAMPEVVGRAELPIGVEPGPSTTRPSTNIRLRGPAGLEGVGRSDAPARTKSARPDEVTLPAGWPRPKSGAAGSNAQVASVPRAVLPGAATDPATSRDALRLGTPEVYRERMNPNRSERAVARGGSKASEQAVERALEWLAAHQHLDGHWDADEFHTRCPRGNVCNGPGHQNRDDCAVTGLVLLAFLGSGNTHQSGDYVSEVAAGINWLLAQQKPDGDLRGTGRMYSQGIATLALSEALGMTGDERLREPVTRAVKFIVAAQHPTSGGWRYIPGQHGDTSIFGWQLLALKSAQLAGVNAPDATWQKARGWLALVGSGRYRGLAAYLPGEPPTPAMTAEALACRLFLGAAPTDPAAREAGDYLMNYLPSGDRKTLYYWYYGTVASFQMGGTHWQRWNASLRDPLIAHQRREGHAAGSWDPAGDPWGEEGGRIYTTALATLCLEVYYRFLPLQSLSAAPRQVR